MTDPHRKPLLAEYFTDRLTQESDTPQPPLAKFRRIGASFRLTASATSSMPSLGQKPTGRTRPGSNQTVTLSNDRC